VVAETFHGRLMRDVLRLPWQIDIIRFVDEVPLDGVDDLMSVLRVLLTPLSHQELVQLGVGDVTPVGRQLGVVDSVELIVDLGEGRDGRDRQLLELPQGCRGDPLPELLGLQLDRDADV